MKYLPTFAEYSVFEELLTILIIKTKNAMKKSLFISALVAFVMMFAVNVNAQERATGKDFKDLKNMKKFWIKTCRKRL